MIAFDPIYTHPAPQNHRFLMEKYVLLYEALLWEGIAEPTDFFTPEPASFEQLILVHSPTYVRQFLSLTLPQCEAIRIGFQQSEQLVRREVPYKELNMLWRMAVLSILQEVPITLFPIGERASGC